MIEQKITSVIIGAFYSTYNQLGHGFLEKVYERALTIELKRHNLHVETQPPIKVYYKEECVGEYFADMVVENRVIIELKVAEGISERHEAQLINYLRATPIEVGLILNFGEKPAFSRKVFNNSKKKLPSSIRENSH